MQHVSKIDLLTDKIPQGFDRRTRAHFQNIKQLASANQLGKK
jgi:hypothetical protein